MVNSPSSRPPRRRPPSTRRTPPAPASPSTPSSPQPERRWHRWSWPSSSPLGPWLLRGSGAVTGLWRGDAAGCEDAQDGDAGVRVLHPGGGLAQSRQQPARAPAGPAGAPTFPGERHLIAPFLRGPSRPPTLARAQWCALRRPLLRPRAALPSGPTRLEFCGPDAHFCVPARLREKRSCE